MHAPWAFFNKWAPASARASNVESSDKDMRPRLHKQLICKKGPHPTPPPGTTTPQQKCRTFAGTGVAPFNKGTRIGQQLTRKGNPWKSRANSAGNPGPRSDRLAGRRFGLVIPRLWATTVAISLISPHCRIVPTASLAHSPPPEAPKPTSEGPFHLHMN